MVSGYVGAFTGSSCGGIVVGCVISKRVGLPDYLELAIYREWFCAMAAAFAINRSCW